MLGARSVALATALIALLSTATASAGESSDRVATSRGASLRRREALELEGGESARFLLHHPPRAEWVRAASRGREVRSLRWPVDDGRYGRGFGYVRRSRPDLRHDGVDVVAPRGSVIRAVADGIVAYAGDAIRGFGYSLMIVHPNGWVSVYAHTDRITVPAGYRVRRGERIGFVGSTGISRGPHLHFELIVNGRAVDPMEHFEGRPWIAARERWEAGALRHRTAHLGAIEPDYSTVPQGGAARPEEAARESEGEEAREEGTESSLPEDLDLGLDAAKRALASGLAEEVLDELPSRLYRNLLWPLRGGREPRLSARSRAIRIAGADGDPVRAAADGVVLYVGGGLPGRDRSIVLLHRNGWTTVYSGLRSSDVAVGDVVLRGNWIGTIGGESAELSFELHEDGRARDPSDLLVGIPTAEPSASR